MKIINTVYALATLIILFGAYLKLNDYASCSKFILGGLCLGIVNSAIHYLMLIKKIQELEDNHETSS
ncbi:hypothetical protein DXU93_01180 [Brumimicrobium aurantiacum]|uniref:Uncharacterized protein n=1 Tax=Brumimicrobium aurantiacum TaxID=1737063 RepID=A0A3E1F179_9FLAO|nr:hypothetical protein DXU93_01180 [Brumimicrobium aurantiacum]